MSAKVSTFSRGVTFVSSGETGTQANEFEAAIKSVTSSTTVGAVFVYDTRNDSDGGAWRKKAGGSWYYETLNTATRGGRREFPSVALIVADNASANTVTIYDLDDPAMPMWMVFNAHTAAWETNAAFVSTSTLTSVHALNGRMYVGGEYGLVEIDFITEQQTNFRPISSTQRVRHKKSGAIVDRNDTSGQFRITATPIADNNVNDVAAKYLEGGELDSLGLVRPVVACATASGVSVIHPNGSVYDIAGTQTHNDTGNIFFTDDNKIGFGYEASGSADKQSFVAIEPIPYADKSHSGVDWAVEKYNSPVSGTYYGLGVTPVAYTNANAVVNSAVVTKNGLAIGYPDRLSIVNRNAANDAEGAVAFVTSDYTTGYQIGAAKGTWLTGGDASAEGRYDRSVGNTDLVENGTVLHAAAETDAEVTKYYDFSASNYFSQAYNASFDFGTGDFSVMFWVKYSSASGGEYLFARDTTSASSNRIALYVGGSNFTVYAGTETDTSALDVDDGQWHQIGLVRTNGKLYTLENGKYGASGVSSTSSVSNGSAILRIGQYTTGNAPATNASISLFRISATAPTPQQVKEIYEAEKPLFRAGAKCLLQSDDASPNAVNDLSYDTSTDLLHVFQNGDTVGESLFRGLEVVESRGSKSDGWTYSSASYGAAAGGVSASARALSGGGVIVDLPPFDVRGDTNIAASKSSDDGKIRFTGVTTDATITTIGQIPVAEGETYMVRAVISGNQYQDQDGERILATVERTFYREIGGNIAARSDTLKLTDETTGSLNAVLGYASPPSHNILVKVTGKAGTRMQWSAELTVQRISEKTYER